MCRQADVSHMRGDHCGLINVSITTHAIVRNGNHDFWISFDICVKNVNDYFGLAIWEQD